MSQSFHTVLKYSLRENCPNTELFLVRILLYLGKYRKIRTRNNSVFGPFSRGDCFRKSSNQIIEYFFHRSLGPSSTNEKVLEQKIYKLHEELTEVHRTNGEVSLANEG